MTISQNDTKKFIDLVLEGQRIESRSKLRDALRIESFNEGQFYDGIVRHGSHLGLSADQWFELMCRLPNRILRSQLNLSRFLSEEQLKQLPPVTG